MAQERPPVTSVVQSHLLKIIESKKRMDPADAKWLQSHAAPSDMREMADWIDKVAKMEAAK